MKESRQLYLVVVVLAFMIGVLLVKQSQVAGAYSIQYERLLLAYDTLEQRNQNLRQLVVNPLNFVITEKDTVSFGGKTYRFTNESIRDRLQNEVSFLLDRKNFLILVWLRSGKFFPLYRQAFLAHNVTIDLEFASGIESGLDFEAVSVAEATGLWQFMEALARAYHIPINASYDMRRDPVMATTKAAEHWAELYKSSQDWLIALACYNTGETRVNNAIKRQQTRDFFKLKLSRETRRYVFFILALKMIFTNPDRFFPGLVSVPKYKPYQSLVKTEVKIDKKITIKELADLIKVDLGVFIENNPAFIKDIIEPGLYKINVVKNL